VIVRILIWSLFESKTTIDELRDSLPSLLPPSEWIWNESGERFGVVLFDEELPEGVALARELIAKDPEIYEEFDTVAA
jgi:hypothetical protein